MKMNYSFITKKIFKNIVTVALFFICLELLRSINISSLIGPYSSWMCLTSGLAPLIGTLSGTLCIILFLFRTTMRLCTAQAPTLLLSVYHIPSFCGGLYFSRRYLGYIIPVFCAALFVMHPVGHAAWTYTLLWLIPLVANTYAKKSFYAQAITSSFVTHAIGSVLWLYRFNTSSSYWTMLIPRVLLERLFFASVLCIGYAIIKLYKKSYQQKQCPAACPARTTL